MVGVTDSAEECHSWASLQCIGDILEISFLLELFLLKAVGFYHNKPLSIRRVASFSAIALPPSDDWCGDTAKPEKLHFPPLPLHLSSKISACLQTVSSVTAD